MTSMDFEWVAIALGDVAWIFLAFALGFVARAVGLPPLVGFLATGFLLHWQGVASGEMLQKLADLGITLLLFTVGLKLNVRTLAKPQVWAVPTLHATFVVVLFGLTLFWLGAAGLPYVEKLDLRESLLIAFALSFSSTVFVVKVLEERGEMQTLHGRIAVGILIMQDLFAVAFLALAAGRTPSAWALALLLLIPLRPLLGQLFDRVGHGELLVLFGFLWALGGAKLFELVGFKGDLGALAVGVLIANHAKSEELARTMLGFKDLFLLGFFLSIGLSGQPTMQTLAIALVIALLVFIKSALFFVLLTKFKLRARTALIATLNLSNYSEFGLIVAALGVANGWIEPGWLIVIAIALALSFAIAAVLNARAHWLYDRYRALWRRLQTEARLAEDQPLDARGATILIVGMGRVGTGAYERMRELHGDTVVGVDSDPIIVRQHTSARRRVLHGDPGDTDFWDRVTGTDKLQLIMLALPKLKTNLAVIDQIRASNFNGRIAATARFADDVEPLKQAGATTVFNIYTEAGTGFATHVAANTPETVAISTTSGD